jgi:hypothetical protein
MVNAVLGVAIGLANMVYTLTSLFSFQNVVTETNLERELDLFQDYVFVSNRSKIQHILISFGGSSLMILVLLLLPDLQRDETDAKEGQE